MDAVPDTGDVLDLYAGVGLFSVALAAHGRRGIVAVEGDRESGADLLRNAAPYQGAVTAVVGLVEEHVRRHRPRPATLIVDPPRTGISQDAMDVIPQLAADRIVYVSCDPPTMARDARRLVDGGYRLDIPRPAMTFSRIRRTWRWSESSSGRNSNQPSASVPEVGLPPEGRSSTSPSPELPTSRLKPRS